MGGFKSSDAVGTSTRRSSAYDMVMNPTLDVLSAITHGGWNFRGENHVLLCLIFQSFLHVGRALHGEHGVTVMIYPPNISAFF